MAGTGQGDDATWGAQQVQGGRLAPVAAPSATPVAPSVAVIVTPANGVYTQADQTALADVVVSLRTAVNALRSQNDSLVVSVNALRARLRDASITT